MNNFYSIIAVFLAGLLSACGDDSSAHSHINPNQQALDKQIELQQALDEHIEIWKNANITDYQYTYRTDCFCRKQNFVITVKNSLIKEAFNERSGAYVGTEKLSTLPTIEDMFGKIQDAIDGGAEELTVIYDDDFGYPYEVDINWTLPIADDEITYSVEDFQ